MECIFWFDGMRLLLGSVAKSLENTATLLIICWVSLQIE